MRRSLFLLVLGLVGCDSSEPSRRPPSYYPPPPPQGPAGPGPAPANLPERRPEDISRVVNANTPRWSDCYQRSESFMLGKSGSVTVFLDIAPNGRVTRATDVPPPGVAVPGTPLSDPKLAQCLVQGLLALGFDAARDATAASWTFPFSR